MQNIELKLELMRHGIVQAEIAADAGCHGALVSRVIAGKQTRGPKAERVARLIARRLHRPVTSLFPWVSR